MKERPRSEEGTRCSNLESTPSFPKHTTFKLYQDSKEAGKPTSLKATCRARCFFLCFSLTTSFSLDVTTRPRLEKSFLAVTVPQENLSGTVNAVKEGSPATSSSPNTHPSFRGRESPLPCGSSMPLVRAPNYLQRQRPFA